LGERDIKNGPKLPLVTIFGSNSHMFSKLKDHQRRMKDRTFDTLFASVGQTCELFPQHECKNFFRAAGYVAD